ncbi:MAG TPA: TonB-dependent receptor [Brevundimonas sp.]|nr:TonB-dependent receptor [Brevundimonas sp.]
MKLKLLLGAAVAPLVLAGGVCAQEAAGPVDATAVEDVIVNGEIVFRNRTRDENPILSYDLEYFQRFEPVSVGEMLKRVPGVTFTSDVLEFDGVSMRGLPPGYTNILINGRRAPGGEDDGAFMVDRIPAELVERIEIIRSPRADQPSDGVAGAINVVLKEGAQLEGGAVRAGVLVNGDGEMRGSGSISWAGNTENTSLWAALNYQGRRNPKEKRSERYDGVPADGGALDNIELQDDTRDGEDLSANAEYTVRFDRGRLRFNGLAVDTDRDEDETSLTYVDNGSGVFDELEETEVQAERISQQSYALGVDGEFEVGPGELDFKAGWSGFRDETTSRVDAADAGDPLEFDEYIETDITDDEYEFGAAYAVGPDSLRLKVGLDYLIKERDAAEIEFDIDNGAIGEADPAPGAIYTIEETRLEPFARLTWEPTDALTVDAGVRYESMERDVTSDLGVVSSDAQEFFPSLHLTWSPTGQDQFRASWARTQRRPEYSFLAPYIASEEPADEDALQGNPLLESEFATGFDLGYERRIGSRGVFGVNLFYREIENLLELTDTGLEVDEDGGPVDAGDDAYNLVEPRNIGDGTTWGVEVDLSAPLDVFGMPETGVFFNYTWLDSEVTDPWTGLERQFRNQPQNVWNVGFIQNLPDWGASFGASLYGRDEGYESGLDELVKVEYDQDLEAFVEKRFGERIVIRLSAQNLLDKEKRETFMKYDGDSIEEILDNRVNGDLDEYELESERSGVLYQLTVRAAF